MEPSTPQESQGTIHNFTEKYSKRMRSANEARTRRRDEFEASIDRQFEGLGSSIAEKMAETSSWKNGCREKMEALQGLLEQEKEVEREIEAEMTELQRVLEGNIGLVMDCMRDAHGRLKRKGQDEG